MQNKNFIRISDAFLNFWNIYLKFHNCDLIVGKDIARYFIVDVIFSSFVAEIGLKAIIAYEKDELCRGHNLYKLFMQLHPQTQEMIASDMEYELDEILMKLKENNNHFIKWRYYFELQCNEVDIKFMNLFLNTISTYVIGLKIKYSCN